MSYQDSVTYWKFIAKKHRDYDRGVTMEIAKLNNRSFRLQKKILKKDRLSDDFFENITVSKEIEESVSIMKKDLSGSWFGKMISRAQETTPHFHHGDSWYGTEEISEGRVEACYKAMIGVSE